MKKFFGFLKKELMLTLSLLAAGIALIITPPSAQLLRDIDWHTLGTLLMMLCVLEGFKQENVLRPPGWPGFRPETDDLPFPVPDLRRLFLFHVRD